MGIVDYLVSVWVPRNLAANWQWRKPLAQQYLWISNYTWTASQNTLLMQALQAAWYTYNWGGSSWNATNWWWGSTEQRIIHEWEEYRWYTIMKWIASYWTGTSKHYEINCNCRAVGFDAPVQTATTESQAWTKLNNMVAQAKQAIDAYINSQNGQNGQNGQSGQSGQSGQNNWGSTNGWNAWWDSTEQWIVHESENYRWYEIRKWIASYWTGTNKHYEINCNCNAVSFNAPVQTATTESQARGILSNMVAQAKQAVDNYIINNPWNQVDWTQAEQTTAEYNGHTITVYFLSNWNSSSARITCSWPIVNKDEEKLNSAQTSVTTWMTSKVNEYKSLIDNGESWEPENPENPETPSQPETPSDPTEYWVQHDSETYKWYEIRKWIARYWTPWTYHYEINCNCNAVWFSAPVQTATTETQARSILANMVTQAKQAIDNYGWEGPTTPSWWDDYPWPQIVFGDSASPEWGAGSNYQTARNQWIADMIYELMNVRTYTTWQQAQRDYRDELMAIVNSHGWNLQIDANWRILWDNAQSWQNTVALIKQYLFNKFGYNNWNDFVTWWNWSGWNWGGWSWTSWFTTWSWAADNTWWTIQTWTHDLYNWLSDWYNNSIWDWNWLKAWIWNYSDEIEDRINTMNSTFNNIKWNMDAATELQQKAQRIYSNQNIEKMNQQLRQMWYNAGAAAPAVYYQVTKQMADVAIEYYKLAAEEQASLAELETQRAQLIDNIKAAWIEADQRSKNMLNEIEKQIQTIRDNLFTQSSDILWKYTLQPMLDVMSNQLELDAQNIADLYQGKFLSTRPEMKMIAASRIFGSDWYYVDPSVAMNYNWYWTFGEYLIACANTIKRNKVTAETQVAQAWATIYTDGSSNVTPVTYQQQYYYAD